MALQKGTTVWLKTGGPAMTVKQFSGRVYTCTYFDGTRMQDHDFAEEQLTTTNPPKPKRTIKVAYSKGLD